MTGYFGGDAFARDVFLRESAAALRHRGPDSEGFWNPEGPIGLGHRRLAIVDLSVAGAQPMASADQRWVIAFNGEIYNHRDLRERLEAAHSIPWRGHSDTEVLVECIARDGVIDTLRRCNGMFAIAAWDCEKQELWLARDATGEKPLYAGWVGGGIAFASELCALRTHTAWKGGVDQDALSWMLSFGYVPAPLSIHPDVFKLPAGSCLVLRPGDEYNALSCAGFAARLLQWRPLDELACPEAAPARAGSEEEWLDQLDALLDDAVRLRMQADVPVAALLSGGIDSTLVVSSMVRHAPGLVNTFTVAFDEPGVDESAHAADVARRLHTAHEEIRCPAGAALALVERLPDIYDEPFADPAQIPAVLVSEAVRRKALVALTGDGGDELFEGYQRHLDAQAWWRLAAPLGRRGRRGIGAGLRALSGMLPPGGASRASGRLGSRLAAIDFDDYYRRVLQFPESSADRASAMTGRWPHWPCIPEGLRTPGSRMRFADQVLALPEGIHTKLDRASMSVGLEMRVPLLDPRIQALSWQLSPDTHVVGGLGKRWLRMLLARRLPGGVAGRRKQGFDVPVGDWLRGPLKPWAMDLMSSMGDALPSRGHVERVWAAHLSGRRDAAYAMWAVLSYLAWLRRHG
ncbi:asparagine synthase (glutamine-hydrolyzing) [Pseudoxanthomonas sp. LH2527]|uniref:asparagine synthase (glutamine-hydrolyzing) n=1 Tax=Pseudoxanthomonas sp. LH2527 TaxID=2923249 RepID=UPI001F12DF1A|nr:asparagine synthase (glutamine-hydrolyzing) [Pseudoxanthomonas sp. LH2527]MCH6482981.1 asparagine synthase (glutamine-hydrolyzing) [Pseudoxanthomonas sp. LH2527]